MLTQTSHTDLNPFLSKAQLMELIGVSRSTIWRMMKAGELPAPVYFGKGPRWRKSSIEEYLAEKQAKAEADAAARLAEAGHAA